MLGSRIGVLALALVCTVACGPGSSGGEEAAAEARSAQASAAAAEEEGGAPITPPEQLGSLLEPQDWTWDDMLERRVIRALVVYNDTFYFFSGGRARGIAADAFLELEQYLDEQFDTGARKMHVFAIPVTRDQILPYLQENRGDIAVANLTITPEREQIVDFTIPTSKPFAEVIVTGPESPTLNSLDDLSGQKVYVRRTSSFWQSLETLNESLRAEGKEPVEIVEATPYFETEDLLEMVNAGLMPVTVADSHIAEFWAQVFPNLVVHQDLKVAEGRQTGWAIREGAEGLKEVLDPWIEANRQGTLLGNMLIKRYLQSTQWVKNAGADADRQRLLDMVPLFRQYAQEYDLDPLLVAAQGYQESGLDQSKVSHVGAIGVMQVMPATANDPAVGIPNIDELEANIQAGSKYLAHLIDVYFDDPAIEPEQRMLFAFAGYNAGPNRINRLRKVAEEEGYDPNRWFRNVEMIVARDVSREPVHYVANIYKYYVAYTLILEQERGRSGRAE